MKFRARKKIQYLIQNDVVFAQSNSWCNGLWPMFSRRYSKYTYFASLQQRYQQNQ